jgi:uncharacterized BrkB/YihY/UPF0761 family membrane protein
MNKSIQIDNLRNEIRTEMSIIIASIALFILVLKLIKCKPFNKKEICGAVICLFMIVLSSVSLGIYMGKLFNYSIYGIISLIISILLIMFAMFSQ